ncbi:MAG: SUMF1/EgtB/PvdO family nonheme iron enzyme, partial [Planctomycetota bacterium]
MRMMTTVTISMLAATAVNAQVTIDWAAVGNAGNAADPATGFGAVGYDYRIAATEVTNAQYAAFLNAVAASDPNNLYNPNMGSSELGGITRSGSSGGFTYATKPNMANKPVNYVSWFDAARFCNWLTNGQGSGDTESGVYTLTGTNSLGSINRELSDPSQVFIPTESEWYKAAYHQPASQGGDADGYWLFATRSNTNPTLAAATSTGDVANPGADTVNFSLGADWNGENGNVTMVGSAGNTSFYGAFDMNGNVTEWNETLIEGSERGQRGGNWEEGLNKLRATTRDEDSPGTQDEELGFRVAAPAASATDCLADVNGDGQLTPAD